MSKRDLRPFFAKHKLLLAPMAGVSDKAFRSICIEHGASLTYTEMVSSKALSFNNQKTRELLGLAPKEERIAVQIFGHEPYTMAEEAARIEEFMGDTLAYIDINMGCPARKIVTKNDGSALMKDPQLASEIVRRVVASTSVPVTVKFRRGYYQEEETAPEFALHMQEAGASALCIHGRYALQLYRGSSSVDAIRRVKEAVEIPVVGNGDITSLASAKRVLDKTKCDALMIGRGACGNPWIFSELKVLVEPAGNFAPPSLEERLECARRHARILDEHDRYALVRMRKHAMWYLAGMPDACAYRARINTCSTLEDFLEIFDLMQENIQRHTARRLSLYEDEQ